MYLEQKRVTEQKEILEKDKESLETDSMKNT